MAGISAQQSRTDRLEELLNQNAPLLTCLRSKAGLQGGVRQLAEQLSSISAGLSAHDHKQQPLAQLQVFQTLLASSCKWCFLPLQSKMQPVLEHIKACVACACLCRPSAVAKL